MDVEFGKGNRRYPICVAYIKASGAVLWNAHRGPAKGDKGKWNGRLRNCRCVKQGRPGPSLGRAFLYFLFFFSFPFFSFIIWRVLCVVLLLCVLSWKPPLIGWTRPLYWPFRGGSGATWKKMRRAYLDVSLMNLEVGCLLSASLSSFHSCRLFFFFSLQLWPGKLPTAAKEANEPQQQVPVLYGWPGEGSRQWVLRRVWATRNNSIGRGVVSFLFYYRPHTALFISRINFSIHCVAIASIFDGTGRDPLFPLLLLGAFLMRGPAEGKDFVPLWWSY